MATEGGVNHSPVWFTGPGDSDILAWVALALICFALYGIVTLYAAFDRWAEHRAQGTPLAKTIPTLLVIALIYEIFPVEHFHILLPISAILLALMADWSRFHLPSIEKANPEGAVVPTVVLPTSPGDRGTVRASTEEAKND
jgi:hypothetical protein